MATTSDTPRPLPLRFLLPASDGGQYEVTDEPVGTPSGFAVVQPCTARGHSPSGVPLAVKVLAAGFDPGFVQRFKNEAEYSRRLRVADVRGIVPFFDYGVADVPGQGQRPFFVMKLIEGARHVGSGQPFIVKLRELQEATKIVVAVHRQGLTHRDLKPSNFLVSPDGDVYLVDFGLAGIDPQRAGTAMRTVVASSTIHQMGYTPGFAPPEQLRRQISTEELRSPKIDVFGMASTVAAVLFGENEWCTPFSGSLLSAYAGEPDHVREKMFALDAFPDEEFRTGDAPRLRMRFETVLAAALRWNPADRASDLSELVDVLEEALGSAKREYGTPVASPLPCDGSDEEDTGDLSEARPEDELRSVWDDDEAPSTTTPTPSNPLGLWPWQMEAVEAWEAAGRKGYVEAVTGSGKSLVAYEAIRRHLQDGEFNNAMVVVPSRPILHQWRRGLSVLGIPVGYRGDRGTDSLRSHRIIITTHHSLPQLGNASGAHLGSHTLLVADECHHYSGVTWVRDRFGNEKIRLNPTSTRITDLPCATRLGLSATVEAFECMEQSLGGGRVKELALGEALEGKIVAPFKVAFIRCDFGTPEQAAEHEDAHGRAVNAAKKLRAHLGDSASTSQGFWAAVGKLSAEGNQDARAYLKHWQDARRLRAKADGKFIALGELAPTIERSKRSIIFSNLKDAGKKAAEILHAQGLTVAYMDSDGQAVIGEAGKPSRSAVLGRLQARTHVPNRVQVVISPQVLDEGIDVPEAVMGVVLMGARGRRQMIQRLGRVLRKREDKVAKFVVLCIRDTPEDPERDEGAAGYQDFIKEALEVKGANGHPLVTRGREWEIFDVAEMAQCIRWLEGEERSPSPAPPLRTTGNDTVPKWEDIAAVLGGCSQELVRSAIKAMIPERIAVLEGIRDEVDYVEALAYYASTPAWAIEQLLDSPVGRQVRERATTEFRSWIELFESDPSSWEARFFPKRSQRARTFDQSLSTYFQSDPPQQFKAVLEAIRNRLSSGGLDADLEMSRGTLMADGNPLAYWEGDRRQRVYFVGGNFGLHGRTEDEIANQLMLWIKQNCGEKTPLG